MSLLRKSEPSASEDVLPVALAFREQMQDGNPLSGVVTRLARVTSILRTRSEDLERSERHGDAQALAARIAQQVTQLERLAVELEGQLR